MSYGVALRNGVPFTLGTIAALCTNATGSAWSPLALWPDGIDSAGMWISPRTLTSEWQDYTGTTPVVTPGTVADTSNPVGLALDIRAGAPEVLGPELVVNGDGSSTTGWVLYGGTGSISVVSGRLRFTSAGTLNAGIMQTVTGLTVGTTYQYEVTLVTLSNPSTYIYLPAGAGFPGGGGFNVITTYQFAFVANATSFDLVVRFAGAAEQPGDYFEVDNISVKEVPGNHMLQSTSAARPLMSARVNTLTYTEDFSNAIWMTDLTGDATLTKTFSQTDPLGNATAVRLLAAITSGAASLRYADGLATEQVIRSAYIKSNTGVGYSMYLGDTPITLTADTEWHRYYVSEAMFSWGFRVQFASSADITLAFPQRELGTTLTPYQSVPGDGSTYATAFPIYQKYDGVDDGMATAAFSAGTLINGMDCMIAVRRDSAAATYLISDTGSRGFFEWESGDTNRPDVSAGTPTYYVDGVACTATRGALFTALTAGDWHILEARGLDLSTWTALEVSSLVSYRLNGPRGDILLFPSVTTSLADKFAARKWLADYYGVTLP